MGLHRTRRGLELPIAGAPEQRIEDGRAPRRVALVADDYPGMKPTMHVQVGDAVRTGQLLFDDKKAGGTLRYTSPGTGTVAAIHRGEKRVFQSIVIALDPRDRGSESGPFTAATGRHPSSLSRAEVQALLLESGAWTALRARPFGRVADPATTPRSIFVTAMDSSPLAPDLAVVLAGRESDFDRGLAALARLTDGPVFVCKAPGSRIPFTATDRIRAEEFAGRHPAGTAGIHIHTLDPAARNRVVWWLGLQEVIAIGHLFGTGKLMVERIVALGGPAVRRPRLLRTRLGTALDALTEGELEPGEPRTISGSVLAGAAAGGEVFGYLGRYHQQVSVLLEDRERRLLGWLNPGFDRFSARRAFASALVPGKRFRMTTTTHGSPRAIVPIGLYEQVSPLDLPMTYLLKSLVVGDVEKAEELGALELVEEDLGLCSFVCPGKIEYGPYLRATLATIEKEG